jgi:hypothetical protein
VRYQNGDWKGAKADLEKAIELRPRSKSDFWDFWNQAGDAFFLAMAHWKLDEKDEARRWYDKAVEWMKKHLGNTRYLERYRAEAAELLGLDKKD